MLIILFNDEIFHVYTEIVIGTALVRSVMSNTTRVSLSFSSVKHAHFKIAVIRAVPAPIQMVKIFIANLNPNLIQKLNFCSYNL